MEFGEHQADKYFSEIEGAFDLIADNPYIAAENLTFRPPVRLHHHESHQIVYSIERDYVFIIRVLHKSMLPELHI